MSNRLVTDTYFPNQWNLRLMQVPSAWDITMGDGSVIGIVDSGIDYTHEDLGWRKLVDVSASDSVASRKAKCSESLGAIRGGSHPKVVGGWNILEDSDDIWDTYRHGTYLAGTCSAELDGIGMVGVAPSSKLRGYVVVDSSGYVTIENMSMGIRMAADDRCDVINLSLAWWFMSNDKMKLVQDSIDYANSMGSIVVAATGNNNTNRVYYPSCLPGVVSVGGCDSIGGRWVVNSGKGSNYGPEVDVVCPAGTQVSTYYMRSRWTDVEGTSQASANMSGIIALMRSVNRDMCVEDIIDIVKVVGSTRDDYMGYGVADASRLVKEAKARASSPSTIIDGINNEIDTLLHSIGELSSGIEGIRGGIDSIKCRVNDLVGRV